MPFIPSYVWKELSFNKKVWTHVEFDTCCKYYNIKVFLFTETRGELKLSPYSVTDNNLEGVRLPTNAVSDTPFHAAYGPITDRYGVKHQVIILNGDLRDTLFLIAGLHELGHFFHSPNKPRFHTICFTEDFLCDLRPSAEYRAHVIPVCALLPKTLLESKTPKEIQREYGYKPEWIKFRQRVAKKLNM